MAIGHTLNLSQFKRISPRRFREVKPFPSYCFDQFLTPAAFGQLFRDFPALDLFESHHGMQREHNQRPHDRYYLALDHSIYHKEEEAAERKGIIQRENLAPSWQQFIAELEDESGYLAFAMRLLGCQDCTMRLAWHAASAGCDVSPHVDGPGKIGTHLFYFNTSHEWRPEWGGQTVLLGGKRNESMNPDFDDFESIEAADFLDNRSLMFQNSPDAWHGVQPLTCPPGKVRRLFTVIFKQAEAKHRHTGKATPQAIKMPNWLRRLRIFSRSSKAA